MESNGRASLVAIVVKIQHVPHYFEYVVPCIVHVTKRLGARGLIFCCPRFGDELVLHGVRRPGAIGTRLDFDSIARVKARLRPVRSVPCAAKPRRTGRHERDRMRTRQGQNDHKHPTPKSRIHLCSVAGRCGEGGGGPAILCVVFQIKQGCRSFVNLRVGQRRFLDPKAVVTEY